MKHLLPLLLLAGCASVQPIERPEVIAYQMPLSMTRDMPALPASLGHLRAFQVSCGTTAALLSDGLPISSALILNNSATAVYLGGSDVDTTTHGFPICTNTAACLRPDMPLDGKRLSCIVASGSVTVTVLAGAL